MLRNFLALIGFLFLGKKGWEHFRRYDYYKRYAEEHHNQQEDAEDKNDSNDPY